MIPGRICSNTESNRALIVREMMYGFGDTFEYIECAQCGCLQIREIPDDLSKYYPENYWAFQGKKISTTGRTNHPQPLSCQWRTKHSRS